MDDDDVENTQPVLPYSHEFPSLVAPWYDQSFCGCTNRRLCSKHHAQAMKVLGDPRIGVTVKSDHSKDQEGK